MPRESLTTGGGVVTPFTQMRDSCKHVSARGLHEAADFKGVEDAPNIYHVGSVLHAGRLTSPALRAICTSALRGLKVCTK